MRQLKRRKAELEAVYLRVVKVYKSDPEITHAQIIERFGIALKKSKELREKALGGDFMQK